MRRPAPLRSFRRPLSPSVSKTRNDQSEALHLESHRDDFRILRNSTGFDNLRGNQRRQSRHVSGNNDLRTHGTSTKTIGQAEHGQSQTESISIRSQTPLSGLESRKSVSNPSSRISKRCIRPFSRRATRGPCEARRLSQLLRYAAIQRNSDAKRARRELLSEARLRRRR